MVDKFDEGIPAKPWWIKGQRSTTTINESSLLVGPACHNKSTTAPLASSSFEAHIAGAKVRGTGAI